MINKLLSCLIVLTIVTCPVRCQLGFCCCANVVQSADVADEHCCCQKPVESPANAPLPDNPCKKCQCICAGATLAAHIDFDAPIQWQLPDLVDANSLILIDSDRVNRIQKADTRPDLRSGNRGRMIRCLHSSLTL